MLDPLLGRTEIGAVDPVAEDAPVHLDREGVAQVRPDAAPQVAVALLLGRHAGSYGFAVHAVREQLETVCGEPSPRFEATALDDHRWAVRAALPASDRCPEGGYGLATVDLRTGLNHGPDSQAGPTLAGASSVLAPWLDRVGSR